MSIIHHKPHIKVIDAYHKFSIQSGFQLTSYYSKLHGYTCLISLTSSLTHVHKNISYRYQVHSQKYSKTTTYVIFNHALYFSTFWQTSSYPHVVISSCFFYLPQENHKGLLDSHSTTNFTTKLFSNYLKLRNIIWIYMPHQTYTIFNSCT